MSRTDLKIQSILHHSVIWVMAPSLISFWFCMLISLGVVGVILVAALSHNELFGRYLDSVEYPLIFYDANETLHSSKLAGDITIFILYALVGLCVYYVLVMVVAFISGVHGFLDHLGYSRTDNERRLLWYEALAGLLVRALALSALITVAGLLYARLIPFVADMITINQHMILENIPPLVVTWLLLLLSLHVCIVLVRLFFLRTRIFYTDLS